MKKPWLLIAGYYYYPSQSTGDWIGFFESYEKALSQVEDESTSYYGNVKIGDETYDWYDVVNVEEKSLEN